RKHATSWGSPGELRRNSLQVKPTVNNRPVARLRITSPFHFVEYVIHADKTTGRPIRFQPLFLENGGLGTTV
ncbi:MAG: hypothetical protein ABGZ17_11955, partial [Planctomycetaceae bacterium]